MLKFNITFSNTQAKFNGSLEDLGNDIKPTYQIETFTIDIVQIYDDYNEHRDVEEMMDINEHCSFRVSVYTRESDKYKTTPDIKRIEPMLCKLRAGGAEISEIDLESLYGIADCLNDYEWDIEKIFSLSSNHPYIIAMSNVDIQSQYIEWESASYMIAYDGKVYQPSSYQLPSLIKTIFSPTYRKQQNEIFENKKELDTQLFQMSMKLRQTKLYRNKEIRYNLTNKKAPNVRPIQDARPAYMQVATKQAISQTKIEKPIALPVSSEYNATPFGGPNARRRNRHAALGVNI